MNIIVTDETYRDFNITYPHVTKEELEEILKRTRQFTDYDYWNYFYDNRLSSSVNNLEIIKTRQRYSFFVDSDDSRVYGLASIIDLKVNEDGVIYYIIE